MNILIAIGGLALLVLIHEAGHFLMARVVGMRPRKFYVFFPPALFKTVRGGTEYGIGSIPLGGYVKIPGMHRPAPRDARAHFARVVDEAPWLTRFTAELELALEQGDEARAKAILPELRTAAEGATLSEAAARGLEKGITEIDDGLSGDAYWRASAWKRVAVIFAGPLANLVFAVAILAVVFSIGVPAGVTRAVETVSAGSPAEEIGLRENDVIVAVDGEETPQFRDVSTAIRGSEGAPIVLTVERSGERVEIGPVQAEEVDGRYRIGFIPKPFLKSYGTGAAIARAFTQTGDVTVAIGQALGGIVTGSSRDEVSSAVGIVEQSAQVVEAGLRYYLGVLALISLSLALLNLLPLLPLDGGHIAFSVAEKIRGRAIPREAYERFSVVGIAIVIMLFFIGLSNDISRLRQ